MGAVPDGDQTPYVVGTVTDVTAEVEARTELATREAEFRLLAEHSGDFLSRHDGRGRFLYASPACEALLGVRPEQLVGRTAAEAGLLSQRSDGSAAAAAFSEGRDDGTTVVFRIVRADGEVRWLETVATNLGDDPSVGGVVVTRDVTDASAPRTSSPTRRCTTADRPAQPGAVLDRLEQALAARAAGRRASRCCSSTSTASRSSTTASATTPATSCWSRVAGAAARRVCARRTRSPASAATSSTSCARTSPARPIAPRRSPSGSLALLRRSRSSLDGQRGRS